MQHRAVTLVTFATKQFYRQQRILGESAARNGIARHSMWNDYSLRQTEFYRDNSDLLDNARGAGLWAWKPYLISRALEAAKVGEFVFYYDVGRPEWPHRIKESLSPILDWCETKNGGLFPGVYIPEHGRNARWTKRECFVLMNCDEPKYWNHPQIQATFSIWQKSYESVRLVDEWLRWCITPTVITDAVSSPSIANFPDFVDHRHDQSILTNILIRHGIKCYGNTDLPIAGLRDLKASKDIDIVTNVVAGDVHRVRLLMRRRYVESRIRSAARKFGKLLRFFGKLLGVK